MSLFMFICIALEKYIGGHTIKAALKKETQFNLKIEPIIKIKKLKKKSKLIGGEGIVISK